MYNRVLVKKGLSKNSFIGRHWSLRHQCNKRSFYRTGAHNEARDIVYQACKIANTDADHDPGPGLYKEVGKRLADL